VQRIELKPWPLPCPDWLPELALAATGYRLFPAGLAEPVPIHEFQALRERILALPESDPYARWARGFLATDARGKTR
jgi:hypothetical protein